MKVKYEVHRHGEWYTMDAIEDGVRSSDVMRHGEITEADVRAIHDIEFPEYEFGGVDFFTDAEFFG
jgi:hypothetical protein